VPNEAPSFEAITPIGIVHWLAELGHADALAALDLSETDARRRVAEAELPLDGSRTRLLVESLAITISEARRFCRRHRLSIPKNLMESPISWSETARIVTWCSAFCRSPNEARPNDFRLAEGLPTVRPRHSLRVQKTRQR
jgi:hypothetical protein